MKVRFFLDEATGLLYICNHGVNEEEIEDVPTNPGEDRPGREGSRVAIGQTSGGRYLRAIYVRDPEPELKDQTVMVVPRKLVPEITKLIAKRRPGSGRAPKTGRVSKRISA